MRAKWKQWFGIVVAVGLVTSCPKQVIPPKLPASAVEKPVSKPARKPSKSIGALFVYDEERGGYYATAELRHLLALTNTPVGDGSLKAVVDATQKHWLRPAGKERWEMPERFGDERKRILESVRKLGFVESVKPAQKRYNYAVVLGALESRVKMRIETLITAYNSGVRFDEIVFLTGQRQLEPSEQKSTGVKTETEMMKVVWKKLKVPPAMRKLPLNVVDAAAPLFGIVKALRPRTVDTAIAWRKQNPAPGKVLCVSNQPYVYFQDSVMKSAMPETFDIETIGDRADADASNAVYLDSLARFMFQEELRLRSGDNES